MEKERQKLPVDGLALVSLQWEEFTGSGGQVAAMGVQAEGKEGRKPG
jgi:hypothetical protein